MNITRGLWGKKCWIRERQSINIVNFKRQEHFWTPLQHKRFLRTTSSSLLAAAAANTAARPAAPTLSAPSTTIAIPLHGQDSKSSHFPALFLRDACTCIACVDPSSSQKNFQTSDIPHTISGSYLGPTETATGAPAARVQWRQDIDSYAAEGHESIIPLSTLKKAVSGYSAPRVSHFDKTERVLWDLSRIQKDISFIPYDDFLSSDTTLLTALHTLSTHGLLFLRNVPDSSGTTSDSAASLCSIIERIGPVRSQFYGLTWDVRSVPRARNVAYTHVFLGLHMDLCYLDTTPQLQFLHSLRARAPGGESMFADAFAAAEQVRRESPDLWRALCQWPVTFEYDIAGHKYRQERTTVELGSDGEITCMNWSPPFQGPFAGAVGERAFAEGLQMYVKAARRFEQLVSSPEYLFEYRMKEGDCVIFDNRRVLHARRAFDVTQGERWLKGGYVDRDVFASRYQSLRELHQHKRKD